MTQSIYMCVYVCVCEIFDNFWRVDTNLPEDLAHKTLSLKFLLFKNFIL